MTADGSSDRRALYLLVILLLVGFGGLAAPYFLPPPAKLELEVIDETFGTPLADRVLELSLGAESPLARAVLREEGGKFLSWVGRMPAGPSTLTATLPGFESQALDLDLKPLEVTRASLRLKPTFGRLEIQARNARDREGRVPAEVQMDGKPAGRGSDVLVSGLAEGKHRVYATAAGYCPAEADENVRKGETKTMVLPMSPELGPDEAARFVLDWGENPRDLDAHLFFVEPPREVRTSQVFFGQKEGTVAGAPPFAVLDVDHQNSEGYETTTLFNRMEGRFLYGVHLYAGNGTLGESKAKVEIITRDCERKTLIVPESCTGRFWYVGEVRLAGGRVEIIERNVCEFPPELRLVSREK